MVSNELCMKTVKLKLCILFEGVHLVPFKQGLQMIKAISIDMDSLNIYGQFKCFENCRSRSTGL